ncbi:MAG: anti-sigma factor [Actinomycetota bacterium]|nr:anti-sigma factor [Actinomycetota bacterium]
MNDVHALSGAYAVDALDDLERAKFERHLSECPECQAEVASLRETSALLADTAVVTPPASLRDNVLAGIGTVRPIPPPAPEREPEPARPRRWQALLVAAAAVTAIGGGVAIVQPWDEDSPSVQLTATEQVLGADDAQRVVQEFADGARATVVVSKSLGQSVIVPEGMAAPPPGKDYQLWYLQPGSGMVSAGLMPDDPAATAVLLEGDATRAKAVGITVERDGGSPTGKPTTEPIALFSIPS